jgi:hypothetical protein
MAPHRTSGAGGLGPLRNGWSQLSGLNLIWSSKPSGGTAVSGMDMLGLNVDSTGRYV